MRVTLQRAAKASVISNGTETGTIQSGLVVLCGFESNDSQEDLEWIAHKIVNLRIFSDEDGKMNHSLLDTQGQLLVISQFTLHASTKKGFRPSFTKAAKPEIAIPLYEKFLQILQAKVDSPIQTGIFGADMQVQLINDGPVTISIDSKAKE